MSIHPTLIKRFPDRNATSSPLRGTIVGGLRTVTPAISSIHKISESLSFTYSKSAVRRLFAADIVTSDQSGDFGISSTHGGDSRSGNPTSTGCGESNIEEQLEQRLDDTASLSFPFREPLSARYSTLHVRLLYSHSSFLYYYTHTVVIYILDGAPRFRIDVNSHAWLAVVCPSLSHWKRRSCYKTGRRCRTSTTKSTISEISCFAISSRKRDLQQV